MRIKLIAIATALVAIAVGVTTSHAALQNSVYAQMKFKKAGGPGTLKVQLVNMDNVAQPEGKPMSREELSRMLYNGEGKVPERIGKLIIQSSSAAFNTKALPYCRIIFNGQDRIPTRAADPSFSGAERLTEIPGSAENTEEGKKYCPKSTLMGRGDFTAVVGQAGTTYDRSLGVGIEGTVWVYNYKPRPGDRFATVVRLKSDKPVPSNMYIYSGVDKSNVLRANVPRRTEIPPNLDLNLPPGQVMMTSLTLNLTAPKPKKKNAKPLFTVKSFSNLALYGQLVRDHLVD